MAALKTRVRQLERALDSAFYWIEEHLSAIQRHDPYAEIDIDLADWDRESNSLLLSRYEELRGKRIMWLSKEEA